MVAEAAFGRLRVGRAVDVLPEVQRAGEGFFVRCDDADAAGEEGGVGLGELLVRGVVDQNAFAACEIAVFEVREDFGRG